MLKREEIGRGGNTNLKTVGVQKGGCYLFDRYFEMCVGGRSLQ